MIGRIIVLTLALTTCTRAAAQEVTLTPLDPKRWDTSVTVGWLAGDKSGVGERWNDWYDAFATSVDVGRYWTAHLKTEIGATFTTEGTIFSNQQVAASPRPLFVSREHAFAMRAMNAAATYQFLDNTWAHPFLSAGVQVASEREQVTTLSYGPEPGPLPPAFEQRTRVDVQPFVSGGAKFYVSEQGFVRSDLSASFDARGVSRVWWRIGGGFDF